jgi:hypothetical protein
VLPTHSRRRDRARVRGCGLGSVSEESTQAGTPPADAVARFAVLGGRTRRWRPSCSQEPSDGKARLMRVASGYVRGVSIDCAHR